MLSGLKVLVLAGLYGTDGSYSCAEDYLFVINFNLLKIASLAEQLLVK